VMIQILHVVVRWRFEYFFYYFCYIMYFVRRFSRFSVSNFVYGPERNPKAHTENRIISYKDIWRERERVQREREHICELR